MPPTCSSEARTGRLRCPHCHTPGQRRSSRPVTDTHREIYYQCSNVACGHTWKASETYDYGLVPSATPDPRVTLPQRPARSGA
ncbi:MULTISPECIES: ogr/Delta-like zinc finger family protein [unclassified Novosphingobium]|uniref:ogr/Delta-like zinc finger family protein n=1 Tax=Novosphingobium TaxID=165696 RepID=UPI0018528F32|nr:MULTISPECIES: ogr/Delta-like zinc finger family protein [unclassified Novosphingobium]NKJ43587.1 hypothetical protein [Novosphingobium sp. SG720]NMN06083.1 hypothetical protein [Novosphingobium sp. SG919]NMN88380.1 hypothetical protein [Novosphingobium sp. SG916]